MKAEAVLDKITCPETGENSQSCQTLSGKIALIDRIDCLKLLA